MNFWRKLFGGGVKSTKRPIEGLTDGEVREELLEQSRKDGDTGFVEDMVSAGAGERQLLNLKRGVDRAQRIKSGEMKTATETDDVLFKAIEDLSVDGVSEALRDGANVNSTNAIGSAPLHEVMPGFGGPYFDDEDTVIQISTLLIEAGADIDEKCQDYGGKTPLMMAALEVREENFLRLVEFLIEKGANVYATDSNGRTVLDLIRGENNWEYRYVTIVLEKAQGR